MIELEAINHKSIYLSLSIAEFENENGKGEVLIEGPYITVRQNGKWASVKLESLIEKMLENAE